MACGQSGGNAIGRVWDGEINGILNGVRKQEDEGRLSDSQAAIKAIRKAGTTGKANLKKLIGR